MRAPDLRHAEVGVASLRLMVLTVSLSGLAIGVVTAAGSGADTSAPMTPAATQEREADGGGQGGEIVSAVADAAAPADEIPLMPSMIHDVRGVLDAVYNDVFYFGQSATLTGTLHDNGFFFTQTFEVRNTVVEGDLLVFAQQTTIDAEVLGDVYAFTANLTITEEAVIHGNVWTFAGLLTHEGSIHGVLQGGGGETYINGAAASVELECGGIEIGPGARIAGDLSYEAKEEAEVSPEAVIGGELRWNLPAAEGDDGGDEGASGGGFSVWGTGYWIWKLVAAFLVGAVALAVGGCAARGPAARLMAHPAQGLGFGFVVAVVFPVACVVATVTVVGIPLGVIGAMLFLISVFAARLIASQAVGTWLLGRLRPGATVNEYAALAAGLLVYSVLVSIPYVGFLVWLAAVVAGFGGMFLALRRHGEDGGATAEPPPLAAPAGS